MKKQISFIIIFMLLINTVTFVSAAAEDFSVQVDTVTVVQGTTDEIIVPVRLTKVPTDKLIGGMALNFVFDSSKLIFQSVSSGSMILNEAQDVLLGEIPEENGSQGTLVHMFSTSYDSRALDVAKVAQDNVYVNLKFKLAENLPAGTYAINITPAAALNDTENGTIIKKSELGAYLTAGAIVVQGDSNLQKAVASIKALTSVNVKAGTEWNSVKASLPAKVEVTYHDDTKEELNVSWSKPSGYNGKVGTYTVNGTLTLPSNVVMDASLENSVSIELKVTEGPIEIIEIISYDPVTLTVSNGTTLSSVLAKLPDQVTGYAKDDVKWNNGKNYGNFDVTWVTPTNFKPTVAKTYTFTGKVKEKSGFAFSANLVASVTVKASYSGSSTGSGSSYGNTDEQTTYKPVIKFKLNAYSFTIDNAVKAMDAPFIYNDEGDRSMAPVRFISEALGYTVAWDGISKVTITKNEKSILLEIGSETMYVNGEAKQMDTAPVIRYDRTYIPVRFIAEAFGMTVSWDSTAQETTLQ